VTNRIHTVGHSTREFEEVLRMLRGVGVTRLVDVRSFPSSRKFPQWSQAALIDALPPDIAYTHLPRLGGRRPKAAHPSPLNDGWRVQAFRNYADYMATDEFAAGLDELLAIAERDRPAIMCSEALPWRCHRRLITDALLVAGVEVYDLLSATAVKPATLSPHAQVHDGHLIYPA
jgi:uncharacterized protein (DUF488 family)